MGGASGRMVFCRTPDRQLTIFCEHKEFPAALELESVGEVSDALATLFRRRRQEAHHWRLWLLATAAVFVIGLIGGYYTLLAMQLNSAQYKLPKGQVGLKRLPE